jgi:hypothetical protein
MWNTFRFGLVTAAGAILSAHLTSWIAGLAFDLTARPSGFWLFVAADILLILSFIWLLLVITATAVVVRRWKTGAAGRKRILEKTALLMRWAAGYWHRIRTSGSRWRRPVSSERHLPLGT